LTLIFWVFLQMVLNPGCSCREAQRSVQAWWNHQGKFWREPCTRAICEARARLPLPWLMLVWHKMADRLSTQGPTLPGCHGRRVCVVDGTTVQTPDTILNQEAWPQPSSQKPGCGFPVIHIVGLFCLASGALLRAHHGSRRLHETRLFSLMRRALRRGYIFVADRAYWSFLNLAQFTKRGIDVVVRTKYADKLDWRRGKRLGHNDRLVIMKKPIEPSRVVKARAWKRLPEFITVRQVRAIVMRRGFRSQELVITTTLLDAEKWPVSTIVYLYDRRWRVEMNFDDLKTTQAAAVLRCKSPAMIRRELVMHAIAYNLVRRLMLESAVSFDNPLERQSFKGTLDTLRVWQHELGAPRSASKREDVLLDMLEICALDQVPFRPDRSEPRAVKRRPKSFPYLTSHRRTYKPDPSRKNKGKTKRKAPPAAPVLCA
jgi:hypothetical protein